MTSTFLPISVWIAAIWAATSLVACTVSSLTSEYFAASDAAFLATAPVQPWSAAGDEKPIVTVFPGASLPLPPPTAAALVGPAALVAGEALLELLVHAVSAAAAPSPVAPSRKRLRARPSPRSDIKSSFDLGRFRVYGTGGPRPSHAHPEVVSHVPRGC